MASDSHVVTYRGDPAFASMLAQMLKEGGLQVEWQEPQVVDGWSVGDAVQDYTVAMTVAGSLFAIKFAVDKFRGRVGQTEVKIDGQDDSSPP